MVINYGSGPVEDTGTFDEVIAFIDSLGPRRGPEPTANTHNILHGDCIATSPRSASRRKPNPSTRSQQGKRAEILVLRHQVEELEVLVQQRVQARTSGGQQAAVPQSELQKAAAIEHRERQRSEELNRQLKAILAHQKKILKALCSKLPRKPFTQVRR
jgi:hypothetical protein